MANALLTGVSGLASHQKMIEVIGNNIANLNSTAFKASQIHFSDVFYETLHPATSGEANQIGGTNPSQVGTGVMVSSIIRNDSQGNLESTGGQFDFALDGNGYFAVNDGRELLFTRAGVFNLDKNGVLVDAATGYTVQRFGTVGEPDGVNPAFQVPGSSEIRIPIGEPIPGLQTREAVLHGNLAPGIAGATQQTVSSTRPLLSGGSPATGSDLLNSLDWVTTPFQTGDTITMSGTDPSGTVVSTSLSVDNTTTVDELLLALGSAFPGTTASVNAQGNLEIMASAIGGSPLSVTLQNGAGNVGALDLTNNPLYVATVGSAGEIVRGSLEVFDARGSSHIVGVEFERQPDQTWTMSSTLDPSDGSIVSGVVQGITFNPDGSFSGIAGGSPSELTLLFAGQTNPQTIALDFGTRGGLDGLKSVGGTAAVSIEQDGYGPGVLGSITVDGDGTISGVATNGRRFALAQMAVATFQNPGGLENSGNGMLRVTRASGDLHLGSAQSNGAGSVRSGQLEQSNVDLATEFTRLIIAQRGFSANARTITVSNELLQELNQLIR